ncbi:MAG: hypothetical protein JXA42_01890 [Anaerolineales bacterium]|nr:hypothetical protein [Anaerolineales bacterium]
MQIVRDETLIQKRKKIGQVTSILGMVILLAGMSVYWFGPRMNLSVQLSLYLPFIALMVGFILSNIGIFFTNRWGRSPRPDEIIDASLKGLSKDNKIYHYILPLPHILLTPKGIITFVSRIEAGNYSVEGEKWRQQLTMTRILRFLGQEGLGNPTREARDQIVQVEKFINKYIEELKEIPIFPCIVFLAENVNLEIGETEIPVVRATKLKGFVRSLEGKNIAQQEYDMLEELFDRQAGLID